MLKKNKKNKNKLVLCKEFMPSYPIFFFYNFLLLKDEVYININICVSTV